MKFEFNVCFWFDVSEDERFNYIRTFDDNGNEIVLKCLKTYPYLKHWNNLKKQLKESQE